MNRGLLALASLLLVASGEARAALRVVATTPEYGSLAATIGGDRVSVATLARPTEDPHFVDAKPSHIVTLNRADVLIEGGADLEAGWLPPLVEGARNPRVQPGAPGRVRTSEGIQLLDVPSTLDRSQGDLHGAGNPHFMMDPVNAGVVASHIADALCRNDPEGCPAYRANLARFAGSLEEKMKGWSARLAPFRGAKIVTYHNTWRYFAARFGLETSTFLEPKPGIPPSPPHLASVIMAMRQNGIRVILVEPYQSRKTAEVVAGHTDAKIVDVCQFPGGLGKGDADYISLMDAVVGAVAAALAGP